MAAKNLFNNIFGKSPIQPIQTHMVKAQECAGQLNDFFEAVVENDWAKAKKIQQRIVKLENEADKFKKSIRLNLPKSLFMPVSRIDLLELVTMQDNIANRAKDIAGIMLGRKMLIPTEMQEPVKAFVDSGIRTSAQALEAIQELDELMETGFGGREVDIIQKLIERLDELENESDQLEVEIRAKLLGLEKDLSPVDVMFLYKVIDWIGDLSDCSQKVGSRLQLLLAR